MLPAPRGGRSSNGLALQLSAAALSFILVSLLVVTSSHAAFVAQTDNPGNEVAAGTIHLDDDHDGNPMFVEVTGLTPGHPLVRCIDVSYTGTIDPGAVRLYATSAPTGGLAPFLDLTIDIAPDDPGAAGSCGGFGPASRLFTGTLADFARDNDSWATGEDTWDPSGSPETRAFRFTISVQDDDRAQGLTSRFGFTWETRTS